MEEAVYSDCYALVNNFVSKERPSFQSFCTEWKKLRFQHIFTMQPTYIQVQQTVNCAFHFGKRTMCNRNITNDNEYTFGDIKDKLSVNSNILQRIGGLYLLYVIYFKQPLDQYTKIEVSLETWREMKKFITNLLPSDQYQYDEARYVFWKLYKSQAFRFTALDYCRGLEGLVDYDDLDNTKSNSLAKAVDGLSALIEKRTNFTKLQSTTPALIALEKGYNEMKSGLTKLHKLDSQLLPPTNIFQNIRESFEKIEMILDETDELVDDASSSNTKNKRRKLKDKAYGTKNEASNSELEQEKPSFELRDIKRMSSRTIFAAKLPDDIYKALSDDTESEEETDSNEEVEKKVNKTAIKPGNNAKSAEECQERDKSSKEVDNMFAEILGDI